jgi:hypothetical protein
MIINALIEDTQKLGKMNRGQFWEDFTNLFNTQDEIEYNKEMAAYDNHKRSLEKQRAKLIDLFKQDVIGLDEVTRETRRIDKQIRELKMPVPPESKIINTQHLSSFIEAVSNDNLETSKASLIELFKDQELKRSICDTFLARIDLLEEKYHVRITLRDGQSFEYQAKGSLPRKID